MGFNCAHILNHSWDWVLARLDPLLFSCSAYITAFQVFQLSLCSREPTVVLQTLKSNAGFLKTLRWQKPPLCFPRFNLLVQQVKSPPAMQETWVQSLGPEDPLKKEMATHSSILAWRIPWTEEPGGLQSTGSQRVGHDWATEDTQPSVSGIFRNSREDFPDGPVVKTAHFSCRGPMFDPWSGKLHMPQGTTKKINKNKDPYIF